MAISDVMRVRVVAVAPTDTAHVAVLRMLEEDVGAVAVCEEGRVVGIFTERDVLRLGGEHTDLQELERPLQHQGTPTPFGSYALRDLFLRAHHR